MHRMSNAPAGSVRRGTRLGAAGHSDDLSEWHSSEPREDLAPIEIGIDRTILPPRCPLARERSIAVPATVGVDLAADGRGCSVQAFGDQAHRISGSKFPRDFLTFSEAEMSLVDHTRVSRRYWVTLQRRSERRPRSTRSGDSRRRSPPPTSTPGSVTRQRCRDSLRLIAIGSPRTG